MDPNMSQQLSFMDEGLSRGLRATVNEESKKVQEQIVQRYLFDVPPPIDPAIFNDSGESFEWFKRHSGLNKSINENKKLLKEKIMEAKVCGERANQSRSTINYLKNSIESLRREHLLTKLHSSEENFVMDGKGDKQNEGEGSIGAEMTMEEKTHRRAIEQEKTVYKNSFEHLKILKPEIEHIKRILEKCRESMQNQFDQWYSNLHIRNKTEHDTDKLETGVKEVAYSRNVPEQYDVRLHRCSEQKLCSDTSRISVNEDIREFYQAKEELLRNRQSLNK